MSLTRTIGTLGVVAFAAAVPDDRPAIEAFESWLLAAAAAPDPA